MSCILLSDNHISAMLSALANGPDRVDRTALTEYGHILVQANYAAYNERYREDNPAHPFAFSTRALVQPLTPVQILRACDSFEYQAWDWPDYSGSRAADIVRAIRARAIRRLPGYNAAEWVIE